MNQSDRRSPKTISLRQSALDALERLAQAQNTTSHALCVAYIEAGLKKDEKK